MTIDQTPAGQNPSSRSAQELFKVDREEACRQLDYLGYKSGDNVYLRFFYHSDDPRKNEDSGRKLNRLRWKDVERYQRDGRGVYVVVNGAGGGHDDKNIKQCVAIFCEWDDRPVAEQLLHWSAVGFLEPTFTVYSGDKSAQPYWVFDAPISVEQWRELQCLLIEVMGADPSNKNPSRVFRLAGGWHVKPGREPRRTEIVQDSGIKYSYAALRDRLVSLKAKKNPVIEVPQPVLPSIAEPAQNDIVEVIGEYIPLRQCAGNWKGDCPFCNAIDNFIVKPRTQTFECLTCLTGGDVDNYANTKDDFLRKYQRTSNALLELIRYKDIQVPVPQSVPLEVCLSKESRSLLQSGVAQGGRNTGGAKLSRDLIGTSSHLQSIGQRFLGDARLMLDEYASRCTPPLPGKEVDSIWKSALIDRPTPSCTPEGVEACIRAWYWNNHILPNQAARGGGSNSSGGSNGSGGSNDSNGGDSGSNNSPYELVKGLLSAGKSPAQTSGELISLAASTGYQLAGLERLRTEIEAEFSQIAVQTEDKNEFVKLIDYRQQDLDLRRIYPAPLAKMLLSKADSDRIDPAFLHLYLLPTMGGIMGATIAILGKDGETSRNNWLEYPVFWTMPVAPPSSGKSQTQRTIMGPIKRRQDLMRSNYKKALKQLEQLEKQWLRLSPEEQSRLKDSDQNPNTFREQMPEPPRIHLIEGGSPEAAFKRMGELGTKGGVVLAFDELSRLLQMDQYKSNGGDTRDVLLQAWNGPLSLELHRVDDNKTISLNQLCLNLTGGMQPARVRKMAVGPDDGDGLLSRLLMGITKTPENFAVWSNTKVGIDEALEGLYDHLRDLHYVLRSQVGLPDVDDNGQQPTVVLKLAPDAEERWHHWWEELRRGMKNTELENPALFGYLGKMISQTLRLALTLHAIELKYVSQADPLIIGLETLERAIYAARWHIGQFRLLQSGTDDSSLPGDLAKIHAFALRRGQEVSAEQVQNTVFKRRERKPTLATIRQQFAMIAQAGAAALVGAGRNLKMKALALANKVGAAVGIPTSSDQKSDNTQKPESVVLHETEPLVNKNSDNSDNSPDAKSATVVDGSHLLMSDVEEYGHNSSSNSRNCRNDSERVLSNPSAETVSASSPLSETQSDFVGDSDEINSSELLTAEQMAAWHSRMNNCQTLDDATDFYTALDALAPEQRHQFDSSVPEERWAWLFDLPEVHEQELAQLELLPELPEKEQGTVDEPTLDELIALLLACDSLVQFNEIKRKHKKTIAKAYNSMSDLEQAHVDALAALTVPYKVFKYLGEEIRQGTQRLIRGTLVYIDPQTRLRSTARSARVWAISGVPSGWQQPVEVSLNLLKEVVKVVLPDDETGGQQMGLI